MRSQPVGNPGRMITAAGAVALAAALLVAPATAGAQAASNAPASVTIVEPTAPAAAAPASTPLPAAVTTPTPATPGTPPANTALLSGGRLPDLSSRENFSAALQVVILLTVLSLAPAILLMMTSFTRIVIVLSLLRQALGTQQLPPNQVLIGLAMFMTFLVMGPTITRVNSEALQPYMDGRMDQRTALARAQVPVREFMIKQVEKAGNEEDVLLFCQFAGQKPETITKYEQIGTMSLIPGFVLSELKTAFILGFKVYLPFLIIDMVISSVLISMGMMMLPPTLISLPFKLLLFVLADGWRLITQSLMASFVP